VVRTSGIEFLVHSAMSDGEMYSMADRLNGHHKEHEEGENIVNRHDSLEEWCKERGSLDEVELLC
jgi:hypothetical protein